MNTSPEASSIARKARVWLAWVVAVLTVLVSCYAHVMAGGWFPVPWPDESAFAWPSISLAEHGSLVAVQANPERAVFWMPPGYSFICAGVFKVLGFSFATLRGLSWIATMGYFLLLTHWLTRDRWPLETVVLTAGFMLNAFFVVMGNVGRMESLVLLICLAGFFLIHRHRPWQGLALLAVGCLVHPCVALFGASGLMAALLVSPRDFRRLARSDAVAIVLACLPLACYLVYVLRNWTWFANDMALQALGHHHMLVADLGMAGPMPPAWVLYLRAFFTTKYTWILGAYVGLGLMAFLFDRGRLVLLAFGLPGLIVRMVGAEMWYVALGVNAILIWIVVATGMAVSMVIPRIRLWPAWIGRALLFVVVAGVCAVAGLLPVARHYPEGLTWWALRLERNNAYMTTADTDAILKGISARCATGAPVRIEILPSGDSLYFYPKSKGMFTIHAPLFCGLRAEWLLVHLAPGLESVFPGLASSARGGEIIHRRGDHTWSLRPLK